MNVAHFENQDANFEKCYIYNIFTINHKCWQIISDLKSNFNGKFKLEPITIVQSLAMKLVVA